MWTTTIISIAFSLFFKWLMFSYSSLKKMGVQRKKYGLLSNYDDTMEMAHLESDEDDTTVYEAKSLRRFYILDCSTICFKYSKICSTLDVGLWYWKSILQAACCLISFFFNRWISGRVWHSRKCDPNWDNPIIFTKMVAEWFCWLQWPWEDLVRILGCLFFFPRIKWNMWV